MWILVDAPLRCGDANEVEQLDRSPARVAAGHVEMVTEHLADLVPDLERRVERRHRLLEDERDLAAANTPQPRRRRRQQVLPVEHRPAGDDGRLGKKSQEGHEAHALAAAGLADDAEHLLLAEREREPIDRVDRAVVGLEADGEILDVEQAHRRVRGSKTSRRPSPSRLNDNEQRKIATPGYTARRGACSRYDCASASITPHDG